ncbi:MAG: RNA-binding cell elongation regulator Jag/EloR [Candidatus Coproplasma sp.]
MENMEENVYFGKTSEEAIQAGLAALGLKREEAEITVLEEGKKKLFGSVKAKVKIVKKASDGKRAANFIDGLFEILKINAVSELVCDDEKIEINVQTVKSQSVIGHHGEILDAIQTIAGAVANIGNDEYKKVVVDCENYRASREKTLTELANKLAKKAVEKGRKVTLEPMNPYERRIIHSALAENTEVKTVSDGREPNRYVVIIPNNAKPYDKKPRNNNRDRGERREFKGDRKPRNNRERGERSERSERSSSPRPAKRGKKEIHFGTYLGNSGASNENKTEE